MLRILRWKDHLVLFGWDNINTRILIKAKESKESNNILIKWEWNYKYQKWWNKIEERKRGKFEAFYQFSSVQSLSHVRLFATPWITARQASLSITNSWSSLRLTSIESVMPSSNLILCHPLLLLPPIPPSIRVFFNESTLRMRWPKYWSFSLSISPSNEHPGLAFFRIGAK